MSLETGTELDELYYTISARTQGMAEAQAELGKLSAFMEAHPLAVAGALGAALLGIGIKATEMAQDVDTATRKIANLVPGGAAAFEELQGAVDATAQATGKLRGEVEAAGEAVARQGVASVAAYADRVALVAKASAASGDAVDALAAGIRGLQREFGVSDGAIEKVTADLFAMSQGQVPLDQLFDGLMHSAPAIKTLGLSFDDAARAMVAMFTSGMVGNVRQAAAALQQYAAEGQAGRDAITALVQRTPAAVDSMRKLNDAATLAGTGAGAMANRLRNELDTALIKLGNDLLPAKVALSDFALGALEHPAASAVTLAAGLKGVISPIEALRTITSAGAASVNEMGDALARAKSETEQLTAAFGKLPDVKKIGSLFDFGNAAPGAPAPAPAVTIAAQPLTPEQIRAIQEAAAKADQARKDLQTAQRDVEGGLARIQGEATTTFANLILGHEDTVARIKVELDQAYTELQQKVADADAAAAKLGGDALAKTKAIGVEALAQFRTLAAEVISNTRGLDAIAITPHTVDTRPKATTFAGIGTDEGRNDITTQEQSERIAEHTAQLQHEQADAALQMADGYGQAAASAAELLTSTGLIGQDLGEAIKSAVGLGVSIAKAVQTLSNLQKVDALGHALASPTDAIAAVGSVIGALGSVIGSLFSHTPSAAEQAAIDAQNEANKLQADNIAALEKVALELHNLNDIQLSGRAYDLLVNHLQQAIKSDLGRTFATPDTTDDQGNVIPGATPSGQSAFEYLQGLGLTLSDVQEAAKELGLTLSSDTEPSLQDIINVGKGLASLQFAKFAASFAGGLDQLDTGFKVFNVSGKDQFAPLINFLTNDKTGAPAIFDALKGIDVSSVEGAAQATSILQGIFQDFQDGKIDPSAFGGLDPQQFLDTLTTLLGLVPALDDTGKSAATLDDTLATLKQGFTIFGTSAVDQVSSTVDAFKQFGSDEVKNLFANADASTASGRAAIIAAIRQLFTDFKNGVDLGGVSIDDLIGLLSLVDGNFDDTSATVASLADELSSLATAFQVHNITDPLEQLQQALSGLGDAAQPIRDALAGIDVHSADGLQQADTALQQLYDNAKQNGLDDLASSVATFIGYVRSGEQQMADAAKKAADFAAGLTKLTQSLQVRQARATQGDAAANALQRTFDEANEVLDDIAAGYDGATIAAVEYTQSLEDTAAAQQAAADAAQAATDAANQLTEANNKNADSAIAALKNQFDLFGITDPLQQVTELVGVLKTAAPIFQQLLGGIDISDTAGRAQALSSLQDFFLNNPGGVASGLFSADQVSQQVLSVADLLKQAGTDGTVTGGTNSSFGVDQSITVDQGDRIGGLLTSIVAIDGEQLDVLKAIASALGATYPTVGVPALPTTTTPSANDNGTIVVNLTINGQSADVSTTFTPETQGMLRTLTRSIVKEVRFQQAGGAS